MATPRAWISERYVTDSALAVTVTAPTDGATVSDAAPTIEWTFAPGTQQSYRVRIFEDSAGTILVYDSGMTAGTSQSEVIPAGTLINGETYWVLVDIVTTDGEAGDSSPLTSFITAFAPSTDVVNVRVQPWGGCYDHETLPGILIRWNEIVETGGEDFIRYEVRRREPRSTSLWTTIAKIEDITRTYYRDQTVASRVVYEYAVVWVASFVSVTLISNQQSPPPFGLVEFDWAYIHDLADPTVFARVPQNEARLDYNFEVEYVRPWGRTAPTAFITEAAFRELTIPGMDIALSQPHWWTSIRDLILRQTTSGAVFCVRLGISGERMFAQCNSLARDVDQGTARPELDMTEVFFDEAV